ncbi:MAG: pantoate--beta-alanine ligase [Nitrospirae bacterium]|nr:pantoate--beta-alanine ligase [Nitrospirota bacterium]MBI4849253.1 pantoate--beta-alanine ligase [Nitrospirota bacterium]
MHLIKTTKDMLAFGGKLKAERKSLGFVPTMGALHEGQRRHCHQRGSYQKLDGLDRLLERGFQL